MSTSWKSESIQFANLRAARDPEAYALHIAALEWGLDQPIALNSEEDIASRERWRERFAPYAHQVENLITFCRRAPVVLIADDVGLGKTISAGLILSELMTRDRVKRALVLCPKILLPQWEEELASKFDIPAESAVGGDLDKVLGRVTSSTVITTYDSARTRFDKINSSSFDMLILDEAHKLRNLYGGKKQPEFAKKVRQALQDRVFKYVVMLTATPVQNRLWDVYSLVDCLAVAKGHENPFGAPAGFAIRYIKDDPKKALCLNPGRKDELRRKLSQYMVRMRRDDSGLQFPERDVSTRREQATAQEARLIDLVKNLIVEVNPLAQISLAQALMSSPEALLAQMENMADKGTLPMSYLAAARNAVVGLETTAKLSLLDVLIRELRSKRRKDWRLLVFTTRKKTQKAIGQFLKAKDVPFGFIQGGQAELNRGAIEMFKADPPGINVLVSTDTGAEGINLQAANVLVNYDLPWNPMIVEQRIGRIQRLASTHECVFVVNLVLAGSVEEYVVGRLMEKLQMISHTVGDIEVVLESASGSHDDEETFEEMIRKLVIASLTGQDVTATISQEIESIDRGKELFEQQKEFVDGTLGQLNAMHKVGPRMPQLASIEPSIQVRDFVLRTLVADSATIEPCLFAENSRAFEKLVQSWSDKHEYQVWDLSSSQEGDIEEICRDWCAGVEGAVFKGVKNTSREMRFQGEFVCRSSAAVAHDRYTKLIVASVSPKVRVPITPESVAGAVTLAEDLNPRDLIGDIEERARHAVMNDADIAGFCHFYQERLDEEMRCVGNDEGNRLKVEHAFSPSVDGRVVAVQGCRYEEARGDVQFTLDGDGHYKATIVAIPVLGKVIKTPPLVACEETNRLVPATCLEQCVISKKSVLRHLLVISAEPPGRRALEKYVVECPISGKRILNDEMKQSDLSGRKAAASQFEKSWLSGRLGLPDEIARCGFSENPVLKDEMERSAVSGKMFRKDERRESAVSGRVGHESEFVQCECTDGWILHDEAGRSDFSDKRVHKDLLRRSDKPPGRRGTHEEMVSCEFSRKLLLKDEVRKSAVSNKWCDKDILEPSDYSKLEGHPSELITCQESGGRLLPSEVGRCEHSEQIVDNSLLRQSDVSGARALNRCMVQCEESGKHVLPAELKTCELTGHRVLPRLLAQCVVTNKLVLLDRLVKCAVCSEYVLKKLASRSVVSMMYSCPSHTARCTWEGGTVLSSEAEVCQRTGLLFARKWLNADGEFSVLRELLNGTLHGSDSPDLVVWIARQHDSRMAGLKRAEIISSPDGDKYAMCGEIRSLLGLRKRYVGLLIQQRETPRILGRYTVGRRAGRRWCWECNGEIPVQ